MSPDLIGPSPQRRSATRDFLWAQLRREAEQALEVEPILAPLFVGTILQQRCFEHAVLYRIAARLGNETYQTGTLFGVFCSVLDADPTLGDAFRADILAVVDRDDRKDRKAGVHIEADPIGGFYFR